MKVLTHTQNSFIFSNAQENLCNVNNVKVSFNSVGAKSSISLRKHKTYSE